MKEELRLKGYKEFTPGPFDGEGVEACYQKCFRDEKGKKYFITVQKWKDFTHPYTHETVEGGYEYSVQLYQKDTHNAINMLFLSCWTLEEVENHLEKLFSTGWYDYYESE